MNTEPEVTPDAQAPDTAPAPNAGQDTPERTFTQAELDRIITERLKRAESAAVTKLLQEAGVGTTDELKTLTQAEKSRREAEMTELDKLKAQVKADKKDKEALEQQLKDAQAQGRRTKRDSAITSALRDAQARKPDDMLILLTAKHADAVEAVMDDEGAVQDKALKALIDIAKKDNAEHFGSDAPGSPSNRNGKAPSSDKSHVDKLLGDKPIVRL